jgi:hypothetical protein
MTETDIIGYVGLALIAASFFFSKMKVLRMLNLAGAVFMSVYGLLIESYPVAVLNMLIVVVNIYYLDKMAKKISIFDILEVTYASNDALDKFFREYEKDILTVFPEMNRKVLSENRASLILRDMTIVGAFVYRKVGDEVLVFMDYVAPAYRDFSNSQYFYTVKGSEFKAMGIKRLRTFAAHPAHEGYLNKIGFSPVNDKAWVMELA